MAAKWLVIAPSVGTVGDRCGNAPAETINGLFKSEVIHRRIPWRNSEAVEYAAPEWVDRFITRRLLEPIGSIPPAEAETDLYTALDADAVAAQPTKLSPRQGRGGSDWRKPFPKSSAYEPTHPRFPDSARMKALR